MSDPDPPGTATPPPSDDRWIALADERVLSRVVNALRRRFPAEATEDLADAARDAAVNTWQAMQSNHLRMDGDPTAYLITAAKNHVIDTLRLKSRIPTVDLHSLDVAERENAISAFIDRNAAATDIRRGLSHALARNDTTTFRIIIFVLDEIERSGVMPTNRSVANSLGLSHTGVSKALARFRDYLSEVS